MKTKLLLSVLVLGMALSLPVAAPAQAPTEDSIVGYAIRPRDFQAFFDVRSGPAGEKPIGSGSVGRDWVAPGADFAAITCLAVTGNTATFVAALDPNGFEASTFLKFTGVDAGPTFPDSYAFRLVSTADNPFTCSHLAPENATVFRGFTVVDAHPPLPTSKDQCKNGGWKNFSGFKNQGQCISFVATKGKNPPATKSGE
jgi:hypothetical protein